MVACEDWKGKDTVVRDERQRAVFAWALETFGENRIRDTKERAFRLLEEVIELVQAEDVPMERVLELVGYIYSRKKGTVAEELGNVGVTLLVYAEAAEQSADAREAAEVARVTSIDKDTWAKRYRRKVVDGMTLVEEGPAQEEKKEWECEDCGRTWTAFNRIGYPKGSCPGCGSGFVHRKEVTNE